VRASETDFRSCPPLGRPDRVRLKPDTTEGAGSGRLQADRGAPSVHFQADRGAGSVRLQADRSGLEPWQFFALAALGCATAVTFITRGQGPTVVILLGVLMGAAALVGYATLRMVRPLVSPEDDRTVMIGERTRVALEREKLLVLRSIKELEFDRAMKRLSDEDFTEMAGRLRSRAARLIQQLDAGVGYREQIEKDLAKRLGAAADDVRPKVSNERVCASCDTKNDADARFCKQCGAALGGR
jgi:hypothetical protein